MEIIEFMGLPGAGKTTLASALLHHLKNRGIPAFSQPECIKMCTRRRNDGILINVLKRLPNIFWEPCAGIHKALPEVHRFSCRHVHLMHLITSALDKNSVPQLWSQSILYSFYRQFAEYQLAEDHLQADELRVVEEGFLHRGFTLFGYLPDQVSSDDLDRYVEAIPLPSVAIFVDVSPEECWGRLKKRDNLPITLQKKDPSGVVGQLRMGRRCLQSLAALSEQRNVKVFCLANGRDETTTHEDRLHDVLDYISTSDTH